MAVRIAELDATAGTVAVDVPLARWPLGRVMAALQHVTDRAWALLEPDPGGAHVRLRLRLREPGDEAALDALVAALTQRLDELELSASAAAHPEVVPFRQRRLGPDVLVTNDQGRWVFLAPEELERYAAGEVDPSEPLYQRLLERGFIATQLPADAAEQALARRLRYVCQGPHLHIVVVTLRCDHTCRYCHASRVPLDARGYDMTKETADRVVDAILASPNPVGTIEFQGGEPLANFEVVRHLVEQTRARNRDVGKRLSFALVSNLSLLDDEKLEFLLDNRVEVCTSLDGPPDLHNDNRRFAGGDSWRRAVDGIRRINERYQAAGLDPTLYRVEALLTVTRAALPRWKDIIDAYVDAGCRSIFLRALNPFGFARAARRSIGYSMDEWLEFYRQALDYVLELNRQGVDFIERNAAIFLTKVLLGEDPNYLDVRSPCGAGIGQIAYDYDGRAFTCDEGRMVGRTGDDMFLMGDVHKDAYGDLIAAEPVRAMAVASTLEAQPACVDCAYLRYCGVCPVHSYGEQGSLAGRMGESSWCAKHMGILDHLFGLLRQAESDAELREILERWTIVRPRAHFVHEP